MPYDLGASVLGSRARRTRCLAIVVVHLCKGYDALSGSVFHLTDTISRGGAAMTRLDNTITSCAADGQLDVRASEESLACAAGGGSLGNPGLKNAHGPTSTPAPRDGFSRRTFLDRVGVLGMGAAVFSADAARQAQA